MNYLQKVPLGQTAIQVTRLGLGGGPLGKPDVVATTAIGLVRRALELGVNLIDTAPLYGFGASEYRIGEALQGLKLPTCVLGTKVGRLLIPGEVQAHSASGTPSQTVFDFSYDAVMRSFECSLRRLRLNSVDIVHIHDPDDHYEEAVKGAYPALCELRRQGVIRALSVGMNQAEMLARFARQLDFDCFLLAGRYTLIDQSGLKDLLPLCLDRRISIIIGGPFNSGILATGAKVGARYNYTDAPRPILERVQAIEDICRDHAVPLRAAALQFPLAHPAVAAVIPGPRAIAELEENARELEQRIPSELWARLRLQGLLPEEAPIPV